MATTLQSLTYYYSNVMRVDAPRIGATDKTFLSTLAGQVDAGTVTLATAQEQVAKLAINTTSVANLAYNFFTGATPTNGGLDYLVSPSGDNSSNLNSAYYQNFNLENRYINFAVNLGKLGEGATKFAAEYGNLTLEQAVTKAYLEIFGVAKDGIEGILTADVGGQTRAQYFAYYGRDGANGLGTKAAMVGWLLAEAAKANTGTYAQAENAFLADLGPDGIANFHTNIVSTYGTQPAGTAGATITVAANQSVSLTATDPALKSTANNDTVTGTAGLDANQSVITGDGNDTINISGTMSGMIETGAGNDIVTLAVLDGPTSVLGAGPNGLLSTGAGNDRITITDLIKAGATIDAGAGDDTVTYITQTANAGVNAAPKLIGVEHLVTNIGMSLANAIGLNDVSVVNTLPTAAFTNVAAGVIFSISGGKGAFQADYATPVNSAVVHLNGVQGFPPGHVTQNGMSGTLDATNVVVGNVKGTLYINVDADSAVGTVTNLDGDTVVIRGPGSFSGGIQTTGRSPTKSVIDASGAASVDISYGMSAAPGIAQAPAFVTLSGGADTLTVFLGAQANSTFTLGAGADTFKLPTTLAGNPSAFTNLGIQNGGVISFATITDFQKGVDHVDLGATFTGLTAGLTAFVGTATTLEQALVNVSSHVAAQGVGVFEFGGDSYIYRQDGTIGANTGDGLIKLVGVIGLSTGTGATVADIHYG